MSAPLSAEVVDVYRRRAMLTAVFFIAAIGGLGVSLIVSPHGVAGRAMWIIPVAIAIAIASTQSVLKGRRWNPRSPEVQRAMNDEWRIACRDRASRIALIVILAAQWPLALLFGVVWELPPLRATMAMAAASLTLAIVLVLALMLVFERE